MRDIIVLDHDPDLAVQLLADCDVISLPITITQVLLSVWHQTNPGTFHPVLILRPGDDPWVYWALQSKANYIDLWNYGMDIIDEHTFRFGSRASVPYKHGSSSTMEQLQLVPDKLPDSDQTPYPRFGVDVYLSDKLTDLVYSYRETPRWVASLST